MNNIINKRMMLEKKYSNYCLHFNIPLPELGNRVISVSPTAYYHHTGIREKGQDSILFKELNRKAHFGLRKAIEEEVKSILNIKGDFYSNFHIKYFFELKNIILNQTYENFNNLIKKSGLNRIRKDNYNRIIKLLRRWAEESFKCHYKINGAKKRIHKKIKKNQKRNDINGFKKRNY